MSTGITGPSSYNTVMTAFAQHWLTGNSKLAPGAIVLTLPDKTSMTQAQFTTLRVALETQQDVVQSRLVAAGIARGNVNVLKASLLPKLNLFISLMDGSYQGTGFYEMRPYAPSITDGKESFLLPLGKAMELWKAMNEGAAPAGVTLPLMLGDGTDQSAFASEISALIFAYAELTRKEVLLGIARGDRNVIQVRAYGAMLAYREGATNNYVLHPEMMDTLPRLSPLPGHTPAAVNASAVLEAPDHSKIVHDASTDPLLERYELRGCAGPDWNEEDALVIASHAPNAPREFSTDFALNQPGAEAVFKLYVILSTGNEAGSAAMAVQRPLAQAA